MRRATAWRVALLACVSAGAPPTASASIECLRYDAEATLTGRVYMQTFYGPPGYGEDPQGDSKETQALMRLARPICVSDGEAQDRGEREITLVPLHREHLRRLAGKPVRVRGILFHAISGHHRTTVLIEIRRIDEIPQASRRHAPARGHRSAAVPSGAA